MKKIMASVFLLAVTSTVWSLDFNNCFFDDVQHFEWVSQERWIELYDMLDKDYDIGTPYRSLYILSKTKIGTLFDGYICDLYRIDFKDNNNHIYRIFIWYDAGGSEYSVGFD